MPISPDLFRKVWLNFVTGVAIITTGNWSNSEDLHGMAANSVVSISLEPAIMMVSIAKTRNTHERVRRFKQFGVSFLAAHQSKVANGFTMPAEERPASLHECFTQLGEVAVVAEATASLYCRLVAEHPMGDHTLFFGEGMEATAAAGEPLVWHAGKLGAGIRYD